MQTEDSILKLVRSFQWLYRGRIIRRKDGGFYMDKKVYPTMEALDDDIDRSYQLLEKSINRIKQKK